MKHTSAAFSLLSAVLSALSRTTGALCPRVFLCFKVQPRVLDALKAPLALVDQVLQDSLPRIQIRVPDPIGVLGVELVGLWHAAGVLTSLTPTATSEARPSTSRSR